MNGSLKLRPRASLAWPFTSLLGLGLLATLALPACAVAPDEGDPATSGAEQVKGAQQGLAHQDDITTTTCGVCQVDDWGNKSRVCCVESPLIGKRCYTELRCPDPKEDTLPLSPPTGTNPPVKRGIPLETNDGLSVAK